MQRENAEASSSRLAMMEDDEPDPNEVYSDSADEEEGDEAAYVEWDEDPEQVYDDYTDDSGSGDDYVDESIPAGDTRPGHSTGRDAEEEAEEDDPEGGFDRLANALQETMTSAPGPHQDAEEQATMREEEEEQASREHGLAFQKEIAAMDGQSDDELLGDFYGRVLRPSKKQAKKSKKGRSRRTRHNPAPEAVELIAQANMAYIQSEFEEAIPILLEVIRIDNKVHSAWQTLAICHQELGNAEMALQANLVAAHLEGDAETWKDLAARSDQHPQQALYCLKKALKIEPEDTEALHQAATMFKKLGEDKKAFAHYKKLIETSRNPHDFRILREIRPMLSTGPKNLEIGCAFYRDAFEYHLMHFKGPTDQRSDTINNLDMDVLVVLIDLLMKQGEDETAVDCIKRGQRWLDGRGGDQTWAGRDDDLEYVPSEVDARGGNHQLDLNLRHRLGMARLKLGEDDLALPHINEITKLDIVDYKQFWIEAAEALMKRPALVERALEILSDLVAHENIEYDANTLIDFALCHQQLGNFDEAISAFQHVVSQDPENLDCMMKLAAAYEDAGDKENALKTVKEVQARREVVNRVRRQRDEAEDDEEPEGADPSSAFIRGVMRRRKKRQAARKTTERRKEQQEAAANTRALWEDVKYAEQGVVDGMNGALEAFLEASGDMIEIFRMAKTNFSKDRGVKRISMRTKRRRDAEAGLADLDEQARMMQSRLEDTPDGDEAEEEYDPVDGREKIIVQDTHFHSIAAADWLALIVKHCCVLTARGDGESALDILEHVVMAGLFYVSHEHSVVLRLTAIAVAMRMREHDKVIEHEHGLQSLMQWRTEPKLILLAAMGHGEGPRNAFTSGPLQKRIHRELRLYNAAVSVDNLRWYPGRRRWVLDEVDGDGNRKRDKKKVVIEEDDDEDEGLDGSNKPLKPIHVHQTRSEPDGLPTRTNMDPSMGWLPTRRHPTPYITYGMNMMAARTYQSALYYFLRAYDIDPNHPYLSLLIAQCYLGRSMNRQSDNKNYQIAEGLAFLVRYRKLSPASAEIEVEYNFGRAFHSIGVTHLAVNHYEKALKLTEEKMQYEKDPKAFAASSAAREAAYNLVLIYTTSSSPRLAKQRARKWLAI